MSCAEEKCKEQRNKLKALKQFMRQDQEEKGKMKDELQEMKLTL